MPAMAVATVVLTRGLQIHNARMRVALDNMSQGLRMFDGNERLVVCNQRFAEMYKLPADVAKPGITLRGLLEYRTATGTFARDVDNCRRRPSGGHGDRHQAVGGKRAVGLAGGGSRRHRVALRGRRLPCRCRG
jgi:PAS domain-containing protein